MKRRTIFKLISISLPLVFIAILEVILVAIDYGEDYQLFNTIRIEDKPDFLIMNGKMATKYFNDDELTSDHQTDLFLKEKTDSTFRVFVQGASTVVGFPFYRSGSFPRMLKQRLSFTFPNRNIEVVNTGMTAVNSYTLLDLVDQIIEQQPDLVIIYAGHNEYYGAMGVGSTISHGSSPLIVRSYLSLKELRFFQLCENIYHKILGSELKKPSERTTTLMELMAEEQRIPYYSESFSNGINQFKSNLEKILSKYDKKDIPVILSTVVSNEKDVEPFLSEGTAKIDQLEEELNKGSVPHANQLGRYDAKEVYNRAIFYLENNDAKAREYFHLAKELDLLRFRAPEKINQEIVKLSDAYDVPLVDMKSIFEGHSEHGIIGYKLMTEHVHPTVLGQFLMADAFYNKIRELDIMSNWANYITYDEAIQDIPVTSIDSIQGMLVVNELKNSWPYNIGDTTERTEPVSKEILENRNPELQVAQNIKGNLIRWNDAMSLAYKRYNTEQNHLQALKIAQTLIFDYPEKGYVYEMAGDMCMKLQNYQKAIFYYGQYNQIDQSIDSAEKLTIAYVQAKNLPLAKKILLEASARDLNVRSLVELSKEAAWVE